MAAAEIMNLHTNFFDEVYESNFMMKGKKSEENENIETKNVNSTLFTSKVNNTFVDKSKLLRISSVDSSEDQIVSSSDFESGSSPLTDTTNEDDVDWRKVCLCVWIIFLYLFFTCIGLMSLIVFRC